LVSDLPGLATLNSGVFRVRPSDAIDSRYLLWVLNSDLLREFQERIGGGSTISHLYQRDFKRFQVPLPPVDEQRRIADFLDDQVARIDELQTARESQSRILNERFLLEVALAIGGGDGAQQALPMSREWLDALPTDWQVKTIGSEFDVKLGKMLNQERARGDHLAPYLRNTNVQWDRIDVDDLSEMDFPPEERRRYEVLRGDLLICEGGQPGRAAVWAGDVSPIYYQKALHRARPRRDAEPRWLLYCLRTAVEANYFAVENSTTTIAHLTGEQLSATRIPFPSPQTQRVIVSHLDQLRDWLDGALTELSRSGALLEERKRALITAAVTGELDVTTARPIGMGKWVPNVGAGVEASAAAQASSIGGIG